MTESIKEDTKVAIQPVDLKDGKFNPVVTFAKILVANPKLLLPIGVLGFLPSFAIFVLSIVFTEPVPTTWYLINSSCMSFFSILIVYIVGRALLVIYRPDFDYKRSFLVILALATVSLCILLVPAFLPSIAPLPVFAEAILPIATQYLAFIILNVSITYVDKGSASFSEIGATFQKSNGRIASWFYIGFSLLVLIIISMIPVFVVSIFHTFLIINKVYFYFAISVFSSFFSAIFSLVYIKKEYFSEPKPMRIHGKR